ncbi:MAG: 16S rRNA (cytidine(1402)-2'-O)-methyltransferase [Spirochaetales bacterium]|jgi:16S rRNA (cytidine1402-2'-O)-methyltransferase|nr:16S rRNA (cytidine(1402)-2'-O)-methyltransferase [Spirochaetales bacterium]
MALLYMIASPLGNLKDITLRALEALAEADWVACEDTRRSLKLLTAHGLSKKLLSCRAQNEGEAAEKVLGALREGKTVAFLSDAGTPGISDPGAVLVRRVRDAGFAVVPLPGPSALAALQSVSGFLEKTLTFEGFLSPKAGKRRRRLEELLARNEAFILYESPFRIKKLLTELLTLDPGRLVLVGREMTKIYEEFIEGTPGEILAILEKKDKVLGEFSVLVSSKKKS